MKPQKRAVIGWKKGYEPQAWWPELPGKAGPEFKTEAALRAWMKAKKEAEQAPEAPVPGRKRP
jgi:hypothetical protein